MSVTEFFSNYKNHPVLFVGTGVSLRYLKSSFTWDGLLSHIATQLYGSDERYLDIKARNFSNGEYDYAEIAEKIGNDLEIEAENDRNGKYKNINDIFYQRLRDRRNPVPRIKLLIASLLSSTQRKENIENEIDELVKARKNIAAVITTNYDKLIEEVFDFNPLIGNNLLLSETYGSIYKIHGCTEFPDEIVINSSDYSKFNEKYHLIRAQLLSIFLQNPIVFLGYSIGDKNIRNIIETIFMYVEPNSEQAEKVKSNFLLVEYKEAVTEVKIEDHEIETSSGLRIRINKICTDNYAEIYKNIANLQLKVSAMDIRKVQSIVKEIKSGGNIQVSITEDLDKISNSEKILAIGTEKTIQYQYQTATELLKNYFKTIEESNQKSISLIEKYTIASTQYFPVFGFLTVCPQIDKDNTLKSQQEKKITDFLGIIRGQIPAHSHTTINDILQDNTIVSSKKFRTIFNAVMNDRVSISDCENYLKSSIIDKNSSQYRQLLCAYDFKKYKN